MCGFKILIEIFQTWHWCLLPNLNQEIFRKVRQSSCTLILTISVFQANKEGRFKLSQLSIQVGGAKFLQWLDMEHYFWVRRGEPSCSVKPVIGGEYMKYWGNKNYQILFHASISVLSFEKQLLWKIFPNLR